MEKNDIEFTVGLKLENLRRQWADARKVMSKSAVGSKKFDLGARQAVRSNIEMGKLKEQLKEVRFQAQQMRSGFMGKKSMPFQGWAMSIMFFGMALQRVFSGIWKSATSTFNDVMHSVEGTVTHFDMLNGSITYLKFVAGAALEPIAEFLVPIIMAIADWISNNEELFRSIVVVGSILGTIFAVGGAAWLALSGFIDLFTKLGVVTVTAGGKIKSVQMGAFGAFLTNPVVLTVVAALAVLAGLSWKAFKETPEAFEALKKTMPALKDALSGLGTSFSNLLSNIFGVSINWQSFAWFLAWSLTLAIKQFEILIKALTAMINSMSVAVSFAKAFGSAISAAFAALRNGGKFDWSSVNRALMDAKNAWGEVKASTTAALNAADDYNQILMQGPSGFRREFEIKEYGVATDDLTAQEKVYVDQINIYEAQGMSKDEIINEIIKGMAAKR